MELNNELCKQIFHNLEETVILFSDKGGEYLKVIGSSQNCLGEEKCDLVGKTIQETLSEDISNLFMTKINEAISEQEAIALEYQIANLSLVDMAESPPNSSDVQYLRAKVLPVKENGRDMVAWISSDITEYKKLEIQLENATPRKTQ